MSHSHSLAGVVLVLLALASTAGSQRFHATPSPTARLGAVDRTDRTLQVSATVSYWVNYTVEFQVLETVDAVGANTTCSTLESPLGTTPRVIRLDCRGPTLVLASVLEPTVVCSEAPGLDAATGWTFIECTHETDTESPPVGSISFSCGGPLVTDVDASATFQGATYQLQRNEDATEPNCSTRTLSHWVRLGVYCPVDSNQTDRFVSRDTTGFAYSFDDYYFECYPFTAVASNDNHTYQCVEHSCGLDCTDEPNAQTIATVAVEVDADWLVPCLQASARVPRPLAPTLSPVSVTNATDDATTITWYSTRFEASWALLYTPRTDTTCVGYQPTVTLTCRHGSQIQWVDSIHDSMNCTHHTDDIMSLTCTDTGRGNTNQFVSVVYDCIGPVLPQTMVSFVGHDAFCDANPVDTSVAHALQLGIHCGTVQDQNDITVYYTDLFVDCVGTSPLFGFLDGSKSDSIARYTCSEAVSFPAGSSTTQRQSIPSLAMSTDLYWVSDPNPTCYNLLRTNPLTPRPTPPPTASPASPIPLLAPRHDASSSPIVDPARNTTAPAGATQADSMSGNILISVVVGGVVALVVLVSAILFAVLSRQNRDTDSNKPLPVEPTAHDPTETAHNSMDSPRGPSRRTLDHPSHDHGYSDSARSLHSSNSPRYPPIQPNPQSVISTYAVPVMMDSDHVVTVAAHAIPLATDRPVQFKDQTRSVTRDVPLAAIVSEPAPPPPRPLSVEPLSNEVPAVVTTGRDSDRFTDLSSIVQSTVSDFASQAELLSQADRQTVEL